jgi:hypothetical protein
LGHNSIIPTSNIYKFARLKKVIYLFLWLSGSKVESGHKNRREIGKSPEKCIN